MSQLKHNLLCGGAAMPFNDPWASRIAYAPEGEAAPAAQEAPSTADLAPPSAPEVSSDDDRVLSFDEISDLLGRDPFQEAPEPNTPTPTPSSSEGQQQSLEPGHEPQGQQQQPQGEVPQTPQETPEMAALRAERDQLLARLAQQPATPPQGQAQQQQQQLDPRQQEQQRYQRLCQGYRPVVDQMLQGQMWDALGSEDPTERRTALTQLLTGVMAISHQAAAREAQSWAQDWVPEQITAVTEAQRTRIAIHQDFYGSYPELNNPRLYGVVASTAAEVMKDARFAQWNPVTKQEVAKRVLALFNSAPTSVPASAATTPQPPRMVTPGSRPGGTGYSSSDLNSPAAVMDTLFG